MGAILEISFAKYPILKFVDTLIANTKGDGKEGDPFWTKAETLLYCALIAYIIFEGAPADRNMNTLVDMISGMEVKEDDEDFLNPVDYMFMGLEKRKPDCFAVKQYKKYKRRRPIHLHVMVSEEEQALIQERMAEAGIRNMGAYVRKMALTGYVLHVDLAPVRELVSLQRRCANNLNQVAIHANTYGVYPEEIAALQKDYAALWEPLSDLLEKLAEVVEM